MWVRLTAPLEFNLTGYDRVPVKLPAGEQDVPERVAEWLARNPEAGDVLAEPPEAPIAAPETAADEPSESAEGAEEDEPKRRSRRR